MEAISKKIPIKLTAIKHRKIATQKKITAKIQINE